MNKLKSIFEIVGAMIIAALMIAIPILTTCSFFYSWGDAIKYWLTMLTAFEWLGLVAYYVKRSE